MAKLEPTSRWVEHLWLQDNWLQGNKIRAGLLIPRSAQSQSQAEQACWLTHQQRSPAFKSPTWLQQVHGTELVQLPVIVPAVSEPPVCDGSATQTPNVPCVVRTADCLALLIADSQAPRVASVHAGWRGLSNGIVTQALAAFADHSHVKVMIGPAICKECFQVGDEVRAQFIDVGGAALKHFFEPHQAGGWHCALTEIAKYQLEALDVPAEQIQISLDCTYCNAGLPSYRRDQTKRRLSHWIWIE